MLDIKTIRHETERVKKAVEQKNEKVDIDAVLELDMKWREITRILEEKQAVRNKTNKEVGRARKEGTDAGGLMDAMKKLSLEIKEFETECSQCREKIDNLLLWVPNIPDEDVPTGEGEDDNETLKEWGEKKEFSFQPIPHWDLAENLDIIDFARGAKLSGSGFYNLKGKGAKLERALINFMLDLHTKEHGYTEILPPVLVTGETMVGSGQLPKMKDQMYHCEIDDLYLIPTAEVPLTNMRGNEVIDEDELPLYYTAYSPCFRREAGAAGKDTRGIIRVHQFNKVELFKITRPEDSPKELETLLAHAEKVLQILNIPYRVIVLCTGEMSFSAVKTYDIEIWASGAERWLEISSCSNFRDFQARRCNIRFRRNETKKIEFVHTLNGSGLALPRLMVALLELYQQENGTIEIPQALREYTGFDCIGGE